MANTIETHIRNEEFTQAAREAHSLKGSSGNIGATHIYEHAASVEQFCRNHQASQALAELENLSTHLREVIEGLKQLDETETKAPLERLAVFIMLLLFQGVD